MAETIEIPQGDDLSWECNLTDEDGNDLDCTGWTAALAVKETECVDDSEALIKVYGVLSGTPAVAPQFTFDFGNEQTNISPVVAKYDILYVDDQGKRKHTEKGRFEITAVETQESELEDSA